MTRDSCPVCWTKHQPWCFFAHLLEPMAMFERFETAEPVEYKVYETDGYRILIPEREEN